MKRILLVLPLALSLLFAIPASATPTIVPVAHLDKTALQTESSLQVPCTLNGRNYTCAIDTGNNMPIIFGQWQASVLNLSCNNYRAVNTIGGSTTGCNVRIRLIVAGHAAMVTATILKSWTWIPLIGVPALETLWPNGFTVNFRNDTVSAL